MNVANVIPLSARNAVPYAKSQDPAALNPVRVRFDAFELDEPNALLLRNGKAVTLAPKPFAVLCALARTPGSLVTKNAMLDLVWGHRFVTESVLKTAISEVRAALGDDPKEPRYIETVSRRGYRFIAATIGASALRAPAIERNVAAGRDHPALGVLTALCRGDAALADLIRAVATTLERDPLVSTSPSRECVT
jgi:DNA-binding winged helix-turn-helix (wHTH) protein